MAIRCYIPTTVSVLRSGLASGNGITPDLAGRSLHGEELEEQEFQALQVAAALAADEALAEAPDPSPRAVVAYDAVDTVVADRLGHGFDLLRLDEIDPTAIASVHIDEPHVWEAALAVLGAEGADAAAEHLGEADLLWYDVSELPELLTD